MDGIEIERDGDTYTVRMSASVFANFAYMLLEKTKPSENNGLERKAKGRPRKEQPVLTGEGG